MRNDRQLCCYGAAGSQTLTEPELTTSLPAATRLMLPGVVIDSSFYFGFLPEKFWISSSANYFTLGHNSCSFDAVGFKSFGIQEKVFILGYSAIRK